MDKFPKYNYLTVKIELPNLCEGEVYDIEVLLKIVELFRKCGKKGMYATSKNYIPYHDKGLYYLSFEKLSNYLVGLLTVNIRRGKLCCSETGIYFEEVKK